MEADKLIADVDHVVKYGTIFMSRRSPRYLQGAVRDPGDCDVGVVNNRGSCTSHVTRGRDTSHKQGIRIHGTRDKGLMRFTELLLIIM